MFKFDVLNNPKPHDLYLCKPNRDIICYLNGVDEQTASLTVNLNNEYELNFDYNRFITVNGKQTLSNGFESLAYGMRILVDRIGYFKMNYPTIKFDGQKEMKSITATSIDCELEDKNLFSFKINTGESDSLEYLVTYDADEKESLINDYTGLPYDYIVFYNTYPEQLKTLLNKYQDGATITNSASIDEIVNFCKLIPRLKNKTFTSDDGKISLEDYVTYTYNDDGTEIVNVLLSTKFNSRIAYLIEFYTKYREQLSLVCLAIEKCKNNWSVGEIDKDLANKKFQFDIDDANVYSFLTQDLSQNAKCVFSFDILNRKINAILIDNIGKDSNVILDRKNFINTFEISCDENSIYTRYNVTGDDSLNINYVNFGSSLIDDLSYFLNARDENGNLIYMSETLASKYKQFVSDRDLARQKYIEYTKKYNKLLSSIDEIKYRVPNDEVQNDWDTFTDKELDSALTSFNNLLVTLISLYKEDFGSAGCKNDGSINETFLKNTIYWYDYYAYNIVIEQINATITARKNNSSYAEIDDKEILSKINAWKTEWSLFGTVELQNKINAYNNNMTVLIDGQAVILKKDSDEAKKWDNLSLDEKTEYGNSEFNYQYETYMKNYNERNSCQEYLNILMKDLNAFEEEKDNYQLKRNTIVKLVSIEGYNREELEKLIVLPQSSISGKFTDAEIKVINLLYIDNNYSNSNILTTSLDTTVSEVDIQYELLEDAKEQLSIASQPQITFTTDIDNLLCMPEFKDYDFNVGNYVILEYLNGYYVQQRLSSITFNPLIPTNNINVTYTNYVKSKSKRSDVSNILSLSTSSGSSSSSGSNGSGDSSFGNSDKIDVTLSNTMLAKLLNTEMFGTRVSNIILDTIQVNKITSKFATFGGLSNGTTKIDGKCIQTGYIIDNSYNGTNGDIDNTLGSIINLETGLFKMAGGALEWNGNNLKVTGTIYAIAGSFGKSNPFNIGDNGLDGFANSSSSTETIYESKNINLSDSFNGEYSSIFQIQVSQPNKTDLLNDIYMLLESACILIDYDYCINTTVTDTSVSDKAGDENDSNGEDDVESNGESDSSSSTTTTTTTITTHYTGTVVVPIISDVVNISDKILISTNNNSKIYTYTYTLTSENMLTYLRKVCKDNDTSISVDSSQITIVGASVIIDYSYYFTSYTLVSHIGTDYLSYSNALTVKKGIVTLQNATIESQLTLMNNLSLNGQNAAIYGYMASKDGWRILGGGSNDLGYLEIATQHDGNEPIYIRQYKGGFSGLQRTLTLLDKNGDTFIPGILKTNEIQSNSSYIDMNSGVVFKKSDTWFGYASQTNERRLRFSSIKSNGTYTHDSYIYGGNTKSTTAIGIYDNKNGRGVLVYNDKDNRLSVAGVDKFFFKDYSGTTRRPLASITKDGNRVSHIGSKSSGLYVYGQWGVAKAKFTSKTIKFDSSDIRLKENIFDCEVASALNVIMKLPLHSFDWKNFDEDLPRHQKIGFIADEIELIDNRFSFGGGYDKNGTMNIKGVDTFYMMGYVIKAIQELKIENDKLKKVIDLITKSEKGEHDEYQKL